MKKVFTLIAFVAICFLGNHAFGQARIISTGGPFMVMDAGPSGSGVYLVVENPDPSAVTPAAAFPDLRLVSEDENNIVKWFIGNTPTIGANYQMPFARPSGESVRSLISFPASGVGTLNPGFNIEFSSYGTPAENNPLPSLVNHLTNFNIATSAPSTQANDANAYNTVDRFWFINMIDYSVSPEPNLRLTLDPTEFTGSNNANPSNQWMIQRFNPTAGTMGQWADWFSPQVAQGGGTLLPAVQIPLGEFYKTWTITNFNEPLSVELLSFEADCENDRALIEWSTASEQNSDYFTVESSTDGQFWTTIEEVDAAGNSSSIIDYSVYDEDAKNGINYYRVTETDINGVTSEFGPISTNCGSNAFEIVNVLNDYNTNGELDIIVNTSEDKMTDIRIIDMTGKLVYERPNQLIQEGVSTISLNKGDLAMGVYFIAIQSSTEVLTRKVVLN